MSNPDGEGPTTEPPAPEPQKAREFIIAVDASTSVYSDGWKHQVAFIDSMMAMLSADPSDTKLMLYWFNEFTHWVTPGEAPVSSLSIQSSVHSPSEEMPTRTRRRRMTTKDGHRRRASTTKNQAGTFSTNSSALTKSLQALNYTAITFPATDHSRVYEVATEVFEAESSNARKVLVVITDGETWLPLMGEHKCRDMNWGLEFVTKKIGNCTDTNNHLCSNRGCKPDCLCGLYTSKVFKDKGYELAVVGIAHQHYLGPEKAEYFKRLLDSWASPRDAFYAAEMEDLPGLLPSLLDHLKNPQAA